MALKKYDEAEYIDNLINPISDIMQQVNYDVLAVISKRINSIGQMSATDAAKLSVLVKNGDLAEIETILSAGTRKSIDEVDDIINSAAENNDNLTQNLYKARNMPPSSYLTDLSLLNIVNQAKKRTIDGIASLSGTEAFKLDGRMSSLSKTYNYAINRAVYEVQQGVLDYNTAMRSTIVKMTESGVRTVDFESGYSRRLDSQVRQNLSDGIRQMNVAYRQEQGKQIGADGIELSAHSLCSSGHAPYQGMQFTNEEFEQIQSTLSRPFFTMNCKHTSFPIIMGVSEPVYSNKELKEINRNSTEQVQYSLQKKDENGNVIKKSLGRYDFSQVQRKTETDIRKLKDIRNQLSIAGDKQWVSEYDKRIKARTDYYKKISKQGGLEPKMDRLRVYGGVK